MGAVTNTTPSPPRPSPLGGAYTRTHALPTPMMIAFALPPMMSVPTIIVPPTMGMPSGTTTQPPNTAAASAAIINLSFMFASSLQFVEVA